MTLTIRQPYAGNIGADPVEWEIEPINAPPTEPVPPSTTPQHEPATPPLTTPEREPVPA